MTERASRVIDKRDASAPRLNADGEPSTSPGLATAEAPGATQPGGGDGTGGPIHEPDNNGIDDPPVAVDDEVSALQDRTVTIRATSNDYDPDGGPVAITEVGRAAHGQVRILDGGTIVYQPDPGHVGVDRFEYTIVDSGGAHDTGAVFVELLAADADNQPPRTKPDVAETTIGRPPVTIDVLANDVDPEQGALRIESVTQPAAAEGTVEIVELPGGRPSLRYTPADRFTGGEVTMTYRAQDEAGGSSAATTVTVTVGDGRAGNRPPIAVGDSAKVSATNSVTIPVLANDRDPDNDNLGIDTVSIDSRIGVAQIVDTGVRFTPAPSSSGPVSFEYTISDPEGATATATVLVTVLPADQANGAPVARPDVATATDEPIDLFPLTNDIDPDGDPLALVDAVMTGSGGRVQLLDGGRLRFTPVPGSTGTVQISYTVSDGRGGSASSTVTVTVVGVRQASGPTAAADRYNVVLGTPRLLPVVSNDSDPNGGALSLDMHTSCTPGECSIEGNSILFVPPLTLPSSPIAFTYNVRNGAGQTATGSVLVTILAADGTNRRPVAADDKDFSIERGRTITLLVLDNDSDEDGPHSELRITRWDTPAGVQLVATDDDRRSLRLTVPADFAGETIVFGYTIADAAGATSTAQVIVRVIRPDQNGRPVATNDRQTVTAGEPFNIDVVANDEDLGGDKEQLTIKGDPQPTAGRNLLESISVGGGGRTITGRTRAGAAGTVTIPYTIVDSQGLDASATLTIDVVLRRNEPPIAGDDERTTAAGVPIDVDVLTNDSDPESGALEIVLRRAPDPAAGTVEIVGQALRFTPAGGYVGTATFTYRIVDEMGEASNTATVTVQVTGCLEPLPATPDRPSEFTPYLTPLPLDLLGGTSARLELGPSTGGTVAPGARPGVAVFTPDAGNNGVGSFTYRAVNGCGGSNTGVVTIDVNRAPAIVGNGLTVVTGTSTAIPVAAFAIDDEPLSVAAVSAGAGVATIGTDGRSVVFVAPLTAGDVVLSVTVADPGGLTASGTIAVRVVEATNRAPVTAPDSYMIPPGAATTLAPLANDSDPDGSAARLSIELLSGSVTIGGAPVTLTVAPDGQRVIADVPPETHGIASFSYRAVDDRGAASSPTTVTLIVNRDPASVAFEVSVPAGSTVTTSIYGSSERPDVDGDDIVSDVISSTDGRIIVWFRPGLLAEIIVPGEVPPGDVRITYEIDDGFGGRGIGTIIVHVLGSGSAPSGSVGPTSNTTVTSSS